LRGGKRVRKEKRKKRGFLFDNSLLVEVSRRKERGGRVEFLRARKKGGGTL